MYRKTDTLTAMNGKWRNGEAEEGKSDQEEKAVCVVGGGVRRARGENKSVDGSDARNCK